MMLLVYDVSLPIVEFLVLLFLTYNFHHTFQALLYAFPLYSVLWLTENAQLYVVLLVYKHVTHLPY